MSVRPAIIPSAEGGFMLKSVEQATLFNEVLARNGFTEESIRTPFPTESGEEILNSLLATARRESHLAKRDMPMSNGQVNLLDLYRTMALAQKRTDVVKQIDDWKRTSLVTADSAKISLILDNLRKYSGVVLPEQQIQDALDEAAMEQTSTGVGDAGAIFLD